MERYDACVIGAGPDGLIAAHTLACAGLSVLVLERAAEAGGRARTREFHPGFFASPFADALPEIPAPLYRALDPARHGLALMPPPASTCLVEGRTSVLYRDDARLARASSPEAGAVIALRTDLRRTREAIAARAAVAIAPRPHRFFRHRASYSAAWPGEHLGRAALADLLADKISDPLAALHLAASSSEGRALSPYLAGSALHLLGAATLGMAAGGLGALAHALEAAARAAGATVRCGAEVADIRIERGRATTLVLSGGEEIAVPAILSTLDVKRTFLSLVAWSDLPGDMPRRIAGFRMAGASARVLFALDAPPVFAFAREDPAIAAGPIHVVESLRHMSEAHDAWRAGVLAGHLPVTLRVPSALDPRLAPAGQAMMTATVSAVPARLFDGDWTVVRREAVAVIARNAAERAAPGIAEHILAAEVFVAPDMEEALGVTEGDLDGGEIAPDQALSFRPFPEWRDGRTPLRGLYLGGPSAAPAPFLLGASGARAARALIADHKARRL